MKHTSQQLADPKKLIALEQELAELKEQYGIKRRPRLWVRIGDWLIEKKGGPKSVQRKTYIRLALSCGWFCGAHRFYAGQKILGALYLFLFWTGIPFAMTLIDLMIVLPMQADENGTIQI
ncbi:MAG: TM2 domain-containing protein [Eubacterium sp.]|nr:TM2 domain-containing protein [Eubacterium sp.]